jgi:hypothetical protein
VYDFILAIWGKQLYDGIGNVGYIIAFHILAIANYVLLNQFQNANKSASYWNRAELIFLLHGSLMSVFPYNGYLLAGTLLMVAAIIALAIKSIKTTNA